MTITKSEIIDGIWNTFIDRMIADVTSVTLVNSTVVTIQRYDSNYADKDFDTKSNFPILIVDTPSISVENFTFGASLLGGSISIDIYTTASESADKFLSKILDSVETYKSDLADLGIKDVQVESTDSDMVERGGIKVHTRSARFTFKYYYLKTQAW